MNTQTTGLNCNGDASVVLVGTFRPQNAEWIRARRLYNLPLPPCGAVDFHKRISRVVLIAEGFPSAAYAATFREVVDGAWLKAEGYKVAAKGEEHGEAYALYELGEKVSVAAVLSDPRADVYVASSRCPSVKIDAAFYDRPYPRTGGKSMPHIFDKLKPYFKKWHSATVFNPVQGDFLTMLFPLEIDRRNCIENVRREGMAVIDLFAGCGGMSLGFEFAGFTPVLAVEKDAWAAETYAFNRKGVKVVTADITKIAHPREEFSDVGDVFGVIGGPPCQGFSLSGGRDPKDPRNSLFMDYMRFVSEYRPSFFVMENVPGILSSLTKQGEKVKDVIVSVAGKIGYNVKILQLNAADYGVPQSRQRVFFVGLRSDVPFMPEWLVPQKTTEHDPVTIRQALSDLPVISAGGGQESMAYQTAAANPYQEWCRGNSASVRNHVAMRHTRRLVERFHVIRWGESAADVPKEHMQRKRGNASVISGKIYSQNNMRPFPDRPSPTVPASFQSNFVHPFYDRNYTAREGARLQSFPDSYVFCGRRTTMSWEKNLSQYQQIGNAVPPLLAKALGDMIVNYFSRIDKTNETGEAK